VRMRFLLLFHLLLFSSFTCSSEASGLSLEGVFQTLEQFVTLEEGGLRLKDGIMEAANQLDLSHFSAQKIVDAAQKLVKEYLSQKGLGNAGGTIDLSSLGSYGIHILLRQVRNGSHLINLTLPWPCRKFKEIAEKLSGNWVPMADIVDLEITISTSETSEDGHFLTTVTYDGRAGMTQYAKSMDTGERGSGSYRINRFFKGALDVESSLEGGVWKHGVNITFTRALNMGLEPDAQFTIEWPTSGWEDPEQTKNIHTSFTQGGCHRELRASVTGSWSEGFSLDSLLLPISYDPPPTPAKEDFCRRCTPGAYREKLEEWRLEMDSKIWGSALISSDKSGRRWNEPGKTWSMQLMKKDQAYPTHNFTLAVRENGVQVTGEMQTLLVSKILPAMGYDSWGVDGHFPYSLFINFIMPILPGSGQMLPEGPQPVLVAKIDSLLSEGYKKYRNTLIKPNLLRFNKAVVLIDPIANKFEIRLNNEKHPDNGEFVSKLSYELDRSDLPLAWTLKYAWVSHYKSKTQSGPDPKYFEELAGNYTWTGFEENPDKFKLESEERFASEYNYDDSISFPLYGLWNMNSRNLYTRSGHRMANGGVWHSPLDYIQLDVRRTIVYEKKTKDLLLAFYRNRWESEGKLLQAEQRVDLFGVLWHMLNYTVTPSDERQLNTEFITHNTNKDVWRHNLKYATGSWKNKSRLGLYDEGSEPGFFLEHKITHADNSALEHVLQSMTSFVTFPFYPKSNGLKFDIDFKRNSAKKPGGEISVFEYYGDYVWVTDPKTIRKKESGLKMKDKIKQTEESPFYEASRAIFGEEWRTANILRQIVYKKRIKKLVDFFGIFSFQMGTFDIEYLVALDYERFSHFKIDTRETPGRIFWYHKPVEGFALIPKNLVGQDEVVVKLGQFHKLSDLSFETNLPQLLIFNTNYEESTRRVEINGKEVLRIEWGDDTSTSGTSTPYPVSVRVVLPTGKTLTMDLSLPSSLLKSTTTTESTTSASLGSTPMTFVVDARLEHCEEPDRCTSQHVVGTLDLAANHPSYSVSWDLSAAMTDFDLSSSAILDTANLHTSSISNTWKYSPRPRYGRPQYKLEINGGYFNVSA